MCEVLPLRVLRCSELIFCSLNSYEITTSKFSEKSWLSISFIFLIKIIKNDLNTVTPHSSKLKSLKFDIDIVTVWG